MIITSPPQNLKSSNHDATNPDLHKTQSPQLGSFAFLLSVSNWVWSSLPEECPEIVRVMQASHYAVIHLRYVTKTLILGGESDAKPGTRCWERRVSATHHCGDRGENQQN